MNESELPLQGITAIELGTSLDAGLLNLLHGNGRLPSVSTTIYMLQTMVQSA